MGLCGSKPTDVEDKTDTLLRVGSKVSLAGDTVVACAGEGLLSVAKSLPWIAPVAGLIGAVVQAAHDATSLRGDALRFMRVVRSVEAVLTDAAARDALFEARAEDAVAQIREALEESLAFVNKLQSQSRAMAMVMSGRDADAFAALQDELRRSVELLNLASSVSTALLVTEHFEEARHLAAEIDALGGAAAVERDPALREAVRAKLGAGDRLCLERLDTVHGAVQAATATIAGRFEAQAQAARLQHEAMSHQLATLSALVANLSAGPAGDGAAAVRDAISRFPPVIGRLGLAEGSATLAARVGDGDLRAVCDAAAAAYLDAATPHVALLTVVGLKAHTTLVAAWDVASAATAPPPDGMVQPRECSICQHTVAAGESRQYNLEGPVWRVAGDGRPISVTLDEGAAALGGANAAWANWRACLDAVAAGADGRGDAYPAVSAGPTPVCGAAVATFKAIGAAAATHYASAPVRVDGHAVGTLCVVQVGHRAEPLDLARLEALADDAAAVLRARAREALGAWLSARRLGPHEASLRALGVEDAEDLDDLADADLAAAGLTKVQTNRLRRARSGA